MEWSKDAGAAENGLPEMLDAIEAGLLRLRRERDELREAMAAAGAAPQPKKAAKKAVKRSAKKAVKKAAGKAETKAVKKTEKKADPEAPKPAKTRQALGRGLLQIRTPRETPR